MHAYGFGTAQPCVCHLTYYLVWYCLDNNTVEVKTYLTKYCTCHVQHARVYLVTPLSKPSDWIGKPATNAHPGRTCRGERTLDWGYFLPRSDEIPSFPDQMRLSCWSSLPSLVGDFLSQLIRTFCCWQGNPGLPSHPTRTSLCHPLHLWASIPDRSV